MHERSTRLRERSQIAVGASPIAAAPTAQAQARAALLRIRAALSWRDARRSLAIAAVAAVFLALIGPFNTVFGGIIAKLIYWESVVVLGTVFGLLTAATLKGLSPKERRRPFLMAALGGLLMTPPTTLMVWAASHIAFGSGAPMSLLPFGLPVLIISVAMSLVNALGERRPLAAPLPAFEARAPKFLERLPENLRGADIHAVKAEDHYLRVLTSKGSDLILMRLSDAVLELEGLEGARIHRSWWVARAAVGAVSKVDGRKILQLPGGVEAPVSRAFARSLRAESWLD